MTLLVNFVSGKLSRRTLLFVLIPLIFVCYFGTLITAIWLFPAAYNWRHKSISKLLYPQNNPEFHFIPSFGIAVTGLLMIPFAGYVGRRFRAVSSTAASIGAGALAASAVCLILAGLIVTHTSGGASALPSLHEIFARTSAFAIGASMLAFYGCELKVYFSRGGGRTLLVSWTILTLPAVFLVVLRFLADAQFEWSNSNSIYLALKSPALWHLGFWEWIGSGAVFLFLLSAPLLLPERPGV